MLVQSATTRGYLQSVEQGAKREGLPTGPVRAASTHRALSECCCAFTCR